MQFRNARRTAIVLATGPTAGATDAEILAGWPGIAVNDGIYLWPGASACYAADPRWWALHIEHVRKAAPAAELWTCSQKAAEEHGLHYVEGVRGPGLSLEPGKIRLGGAIGNSGAQAMNLAALWGARHLILIGFDMCRVDDRTHYFGDHPPPLQQGDCWDTFVAQMGPMAADLARERIEVVNTSRVSRLPYFAKQTIVAALLAAASDAAAR